MHPFMRIRFFVCLVRVTLVSRPCCGYIGLFSNGSALGDFSTFFDNASCFGMDKLGTSRNVSQAQKLSANKWTFVDTL